MLNPADVLKIKYEFIRKVGLFLGKRTYLADTCYEELIPYFSDAVQTEIFTDCLEYSDECLLTSKADKYDDPPEDVLPVSCNDQISISLSKTSTSCTATSFARNDVGGIQPKIVIYNDEIIHDAVIDLGVTESCIKGGGEQTEEVRVGCTGDPESCDDLARIGAYTGVGFGALPLLYPAGYVKTIRFYFGKVGSQYQMDIDVSPSNVPTWTACGGCNPVNAAHLYFSATPANYTVAWETLMANIAETLGAETEPRFEVFGAGVNASWNYWGRIKHNPDSAGPHWMGINKYDSRFTINDGTTDFQFNNTAVLINQTSFLSQTVEFTTSCGTVEVTGNSNAGGSGTLAGDTNYITLQFVSSYLPLNITTTIIGDTTCTITTVTATYNTTSLIDTIEWLDPSDVVIASTSPLTYISGDHTFTTTTNETGEFTFRVTLDNGCIDSSTITV